MNTEREAITLEMPVLRWDELEGDFLTREQIRRQIAIEEIDQALERALDESA